MRIYIASDLHLEFYPSVDSYPKLTENYHLDSILILAGDIITANKVLKSKSWWEYLSKRFKHIITCRGNHCFYYGTLEDKRLQETISDFKNITLLDNQSITIDNIEFFGTTLWTDINNGNPIDELNVRLGFDRSDFRCIEGLTIAKWKAMNRRAREAIREWCEYVNPTHKKVIITHHLPDYSLVNEKWKHSDINAGFANTHMEDLFYEYEPDLWVNGHTHDGFDTMIYNTRCICNPRGYHKYEQDKVDNFKLKIVEV